MFGECNVETVCTVPAGMQGAESICTPEERTIALLHGFQQSAKDFEGIKRPRVFFWREFSRFAFFAQDEQNFRN